MQRIRDPFASTAIHRKICQWADMGVRGTPGKKGGSDKSYECVTVTACVVSQPRHLSPSTLASNLPWCAETCGRNQANNALAQRKTCGGRFAEKPRRFAPANIVTLIVIVLRRGEIDRASIRRGGKVEYGIIFMISRRSGREADGAVSEIGVDNCARARNEALERSSCVGRWYAMYLRGLLGRLFEGRLKNITRRKRNKRR